MKIVKIINSLEQGGAEKLVVELANQFALDNDVYLITFKDDSDNTNQFHFPELSSTVKYINLKLKRGLKFTDILTLYRTLKQIKPDVVHCHLYVIFHTALFAVLNRKTRFFHTIHNDAEADCTVKRTKFIRRFLYKWNIFIPVTISNQSNDSYNKFYRLNNSQLIYNGRKLPVKSERFEVVKNEIDSLKLNNTDKVLVHVARFDLHQKNQEMLVKVINRLIDEQFQLILLIIGVGFDSEKASELKSVAGKGIYFIGPKNNVPDYLFLSDAFCLSSRHEGMPISLFEALACGCTPVCTPVGGIKDIIQDGKNGFLSTDTDENSYYEVLKKYLRYSEKIKKEDLITYYKNNFTIEKCANNHLRLYCN